MKNIPNISFQGSSENEKYFECLKLSTLFPRIFTELEHKPNLPHKITFFALIIITKGKGSHQIDLKNYNLEAGTVLKIAKGQVHAFEKKPKYDGYLIIFTEDFILNYFSKSSINLISNFYNYHLSSPVFKNKKGNNIFLNSLKNEFKSENTFAQNNIIAALLDLYLLELERNSRSDQTPNNSKHYNTFIKFKNLVETNYTKTRNVKDYADILLISTKSLNQIVKAFTLNTAKIFIDEYVTLEVKREIVSTNKSLKEIAFDIGFDEVTNFTKFFKKKTNFTPKEFRLKN